MNVYQKYYINMFVYIQIATYQKEITFNKVNQIIKGFIDKEHFENNYLICHFI